MSMRWSISKWLFCFGSAVLLLAGSAVRAYGDENSKVPPEIKKEKKVMRYRNNWARLIPRYEKIQYAGAMGLISLGVGWDYGRKKQWETDFFLGFLPRFDGDKAHVTMTLKENYIPWKLNIKESNWIVEPFTVSMYINKILGDEFWGRLPDKYPEKYYSFVTNLRLNLAFGQRIGVKLNSGVLSNCLTFFYEFGTNDLYLISYMTNKYWKFTDLFSLSLGLKVQFL